MSDPVELAQSMMEIDSTSGHEGAVITHVERILAENGWKVERIPVTPGRDNLYVRSVDTPLVTLSTHLDTVPPYIPPRLAGDVLHGRGACDAKGIAASMICAAERLREVNVPVALLLVVGEEVSHDGALAANDYARREGISNRILINGEPTESCLALGTKGAMRVTLTTHGRAAHSAYPELGHSATMDMVRLLAELDRVQLPQDEMLGATTINLGKLSGGVADNVIAPEAEARLMARTTGDSEELLSLLRGWIDGRAELEQGVTVPPVRLGTLPGFRTSVVAYATDIPALGNWGTPYLYGPGSIHVAHTDDEQVTVAELLSAVDAYVRIATESLELKTH
jgi:acetylornithine deacetylase